MDNEPATQTPPESFTPLQTTTSVSQSDARWSWGAFLLGPLFLIGIRKYSWLWSYLLAFIPLLNVLFFIGFMIVLGMKGRQLAAESTMFSNRDEFVGYMKGIDHAGKVAAIVYAVVFLLLGALFATMIGSSPNMAREKAMDAREQSNMQFEQTAGDLESDFGTYESEDVPFEANEQYLQGGLPVETETAVDTPTVQ